MRDTVPAPALLLAAAVVLSAFAVPVAAAESSAAASIAIDRAVTDDRIAPGESTTVTLTVQVDRETERLSIAERFSPGVARAAVERVSFSEGSGTEVTSLGLHDGLDVAVRDLAAGTTVTVTYRITLPESADAGTTVEIDGTIHSGAGNASIATDEIAVARATATRSIDATTLEPGAETTVTLETTVYETTPRLAIAERFDPPFERVSITDVSIDGHGELLTRIGRNRSVDVAVANLTAGTTVTVAYDVRLPADATADRTFEIDGTVYLPGGSVTPTGQSSVTATAPVESDIAGEDGAVDTADLREGIERWATEAALEAADRRVETDDLRTLIQRWAADAKRE